MYGELYGYEGGSPALVKDTLEYNLGFRPDYYVRTDFDGLISIVDLLGGIDVPVHCTLSDHWPYPDENGEYPMLTLEPGVHHMDGETALWYARSRKTTSVFSRERRQQQILQAIWREIRRQNLLPHVPQLWETSQSMVQTDLDFATMLNLARIGFQLNESAVRYRNISYSHVTPWTTPQGGNVFLPNWEELEPVLQEALGPVPEARRANVAPYVEVWNGTPNTGYGSLAADRLYRAGYNAVLGIADSQSYTQTQILIFAENDKGLGLGWLQWKFGVSDDRVSHTPDPNQPYPLRVIIGADYEPCDPNF
jgi:LCP family protein required for cell wall assembly